jgi:phage gpG-like protein
MDSSGMVTSAQIANAISGIRFDRHIESFEFKPSLGIVAGKLQAFASSLQDMREPLTRSVTEVMQYSILENFMSGGRPSWAPLSENTTKFHAKDGAGMILVRSGALAETASSPRIWSIGSKTATIRDLPDKVWYGKVHQAGLAGNAYSANNWFGKYKSAARKIEGPEASDAEVTKTAYKLFDKRTLSHGAAPRGTPSIPARPFAMFQEEDIDAIQLIFVEWVEEQMREAGLFR